MILKGMKTRPPQMASVPKPASATPSKLEARPVPWVEEGKVVNVPPVKLERVVPLRNITTPSYMEVIGLRAAKSTPPAGREREIKLSLLGEDEMARVAQLLGDPIGELRQFNLFYEDPEGAFKRAGYSVRFRLENDRLELTIKGKSTTKDGISDRIEETLELPASLWEALSLSHADVSRLVRRLLEERRLTLPEDLDPSKLELLGGFTNTRYVYRLPGDADHKVELDYSVYPNGVACFEAELELQDRGGTKKVRSKLHAVFEAAEVAWRPSDLPKMARLRAALSGTDPK